MRDSYDKFPELRLQAVEPSQAVAQLQPPLTDLAARLAIMLCDDPTDPELFEIESYLDIARRH